MGVTFIKRLENRSRSTIRLLNKENSTTRGHGIAVPPGSSIAIDMAIPWAPAQTDFAGHHLEIVVGGVTRYWIWQAANADGDFIRFSTDGAWHDRGERVHGYAGVATNFFEAVAGFFSSNVEPLAQMFLGDRALVVLDSHFESVPIAPKPFGPPFTVIKQLENRSTSTVTIFNVETQQNVNVPAGQTAALNMTVPWAGASGDFPGHHIRVAVGGVTRFWIWQHEHRNDGDYVRFSTSGVWAPLAARVKGFAGTGVCPADLVFTGDRSIIVSNTEIELMPHPLLFDGLLDFANQFITRARRIGETVQPAASGAKRSATAFSMPGPVSDAFLRGQSGARFLYKETGKRYEFTLGSDGKVTAIHPDGTRTLLDKAFSYRRIRKGEPITAPPFDLIAANGARVFAKAKDADDFYFTTMDEHYVYKSKESPESDPERIVPSSYFKIDPEFGQANANQSDLLFSTNDIRPDHPASERFPLFRRVLQRQPVDMMIATVKSREWQQLDFRPPQNVVPNAIGKLILDLMPLAISVAGAAASLGPLMLLGQLAYFTFFKDRLAANLSDQAAAASEPPSGTPTYRPITYQRPDGSTFQPPAIRYDRVLDIGVGHVHHHQQYQRVTGGEIQPMLLVDFYKAVYRFFNGPVRDGDGYIDGTSNFYALVKHDASFSLLFQDEQLYFSQRWRVVGPDDIKGTMFSLAGDLAAQPAYQWNPSTYWCPLKSGHINDASRLAVAAQVLLVTGVDPAANAWRIYSINFSWGSMDRTWRWRKLPANAAVELFSATAVAAGDETIPPASQANVYPQTIRLRDDFTINLKGNGNAGGQWVVGRWYQRYLPADNNVVPRRGQLIAGQMPPSGYEHHWKFFPERVFRLADNFHFFGVYDEVDSRTQYYDITPATATDASKLELSPGPWIDDMRQLYVSQWKFRWHDTRLPGADPLDAPSLFNPDTRFRIVRKGSRWIATFWDKRDDDMMPFERLPRLVTLKRGTETVQVTIGANHFLMDPPIVQGAYFWWEANGVAGVAFESRAATVHALRENITRVRMASLEGDTVDPARVARVNQLFDKVTDGNFNVVESGLFEFRWTPLPAEQALLQQHASANGETQFGTSIWFEDVAGNVAPPERVFWQRSARAQAVATPAMVPLNVATQVTVRATDFRTGAPLTGVVKVDGQVVGTTDVPFTYTFTTTLEQEWDPELRRLITTGVINPTVSVKAPDYPEVEVPITFYTARLNVRLEPASVPIGPTVQVMVKAEDAITLAPAPGRVIIAGMDVGPTNQAFNFAFAPGHTSGSVNAAGYPSKTFPIALFTPEMQLVVSPSPIPSGRPVEVVVRAVDKRTGAPVNGRVKLNGVDTAATNTPFMLTFGLTPPVGVVSAPFYADAVIAWPPISVPTMVTGITPFPVPFNRTIQATISAVDAQTGALVAGRVKINGVDVGPTNTPITTIFRTRVVGAELEPVGPSVIVTAPGYNNTWVDVGFG